MLCYDALTYFKKLSEFKLLKGMSNCVHLANTDVTETISDDKVRSCYNYIIITAIIIIR